MGRRCDRCRVEYESGADYGGKDYCMTCLVTVRQMDERKRREEEQKRQQMADYRKKSMGERYAKDYIDRRRQDAEELKRREIISERRLREAADTRMQKERDQQRKKEEEQARRDLAVESLWQAKKAPGKPDEKEGRRWWEEDRRLKTVGGGAYAPSTAKPRRKLSVPPPQEQEEQAFFPGASTFEPDYEKKGEERIIIEAPKTVTLALSALASLPVSLSVGQTGIEVALLGKNLSAQKVNAHLVVSVNDSRQNRLDATAEPEKCSLDPDCEAKFGLLFDLKEDTARGELILSAYLKENAYYIDREAGRSDAVLMRSQVKTPMDLAFVNGSCSQEDGKLCLLFDNKGESGGIVEKKSFALVLAGKGSGKGEGKEKCEMESRVKCKGFEKKVKLIFARKKASLPVPDAVELSLIGADSNGKPYRKAQKLEGKALYGSMK